VLPVFPDRTDCVNDVSGGQFIPFRDLGVTGFTASQPCAFLQQLRSGNAMYGSIDTTATQQGVVGGVDNGIHNQRRYVGLDYFDDSWHGSSAALINGIRALMK
jgi:hypothetical protein